jgi:hypothetical protein
MDETFREFLVRIIRDTKIMSANQQVYGTYKLIFTVPDEGYCILDIKNNTQKWYTPKRRFKYIFNRNDVEYVERLPDTIIRDISILRLTGEL